MAVPAGAVWCRAAGRFAASAACLQLGSTCTEQHTPCTDPQRHPACNARADDERSGIAALQIGERLAYEAQFVRKSLDPLPQQQKLDKGE